MAASDLTAARLRELLHYDPETGDFVWKKSAKTHLNGRLAGSKQSKGYLAIQVDGHHHLSHRLAHLYMTGLHPSGQIDHIDGVRANNAWSNLREVTQSQNNQNQRRAHVDSSSGYLGVTHCRQNALSPWKAQIVVPGKGRVWLGSYRTPEEAHAAYVAAKRVHHAAGNL